MPDQEGRFAIVTNVGSGDAVDVCGALDECAARRTAKSCGLDASTLASSRRDDPPAMVARKPDHQREHEAAVKTIAQGRPGVPVDLW